MRGESARMGRMGYRWRVGAMSGLGALALASIFALSSVANAGIAHPNSFPGAYWSPFTFRENEGCAQAHAYPAHWAATTGHGSWKGAVSAKTCPAYRGGTNVESIGEVEGELNVYAPVSLPSGSGGVNVSWNLNVAYSDSGGLSGTNYSCPQTIYAYNYNYGYTWFNFTEVFANCEAGANADIGGFAYLYDQTTSSYYYPSNYWAGVFNDSGTENYSFSYSYTYSNSSYWAYNYSYSYALNGTFGSAGSFSGTLAPQWFINGTFSSTDSYQVETYIFSSMEALAFGFSNSAHGASSINMAGTTHHENLLPFSVW